jgi:hypothetical protein
MISLKLPKVLLDRLEEEARNRRRSKSAVVRDCLTETLLLPRQGKKLTCADLAGHLVGSVHGPRDLSSRLDYYLEKAMRKELARERKHSR